MLPASWRPSRRQVSPALPCRPLTQAAHPGRLSVAACFAVLGPVVLCSAWSAVCRLLSAAVVSPPVPPSDPLRVQAVLAYTQPPRGGLPRPARPRLKPPPRASGRSELSPPPSSPFAVVLWALGLRTVGPPSLPSLSSMMALSLLTADPRVPGLVVCT